MAMTKYAIIILTMILSTQVYSQDDPYSEPVMSKKEQRKLAREKKKAEQLAEQAEYQKLLSELIEQRRFVLEADYVSWRAQSRHPVNSTLNFIIVDSADAVIQLGSPWGIGYNGVCGVTIDGSVTKYDVSVKEGKRGTSYSIMLYITTAVGPYDIQLWISGSGNADATVRGNFSGSLTYSGRIKSPAQSRVYKGSSI